MYDKNVISPEVAEAQSLLRFFLALLEKLNWRKTLVHPYSTANEKTKA
jgi:hypothetical protein